MRNFWWAVGILTVAAALSISPAEAEYLFDDLYGPSGIGEQWMVITGGLDTVGARAGGSVTDTSDQMALEASGDIVSGRNSVVVMNGKSTPQLGVNANRDIHRVFFVITDGVDDVPRGTLTVDYHAPLINEATTTDVLDGSFPEYQVKKTPQATVNKTAKRYELMFEKRSNQNQASGGYGSVRGTLIFHQNPSNTRSQTLEVPFVIANVCDGTAEKNPLDIRATLRDNNTVNRQRNIVAYNKISWNVTDTKTAGGDQWVLLPVSTMYPTEEKIYYNLITEVRNHTAIAYATQRYDDYDTTYANLWWRFDLPHTFTNAEDNLHEKFQLNDLSHAAPGLITGYAQRYNVNEGQKRALRLYPVDPAGSHYDLILNHRVLRCIDIGRAEGSASNYNDPLPYQAMAFNLRAASTNFLENVATKMKTVGGQELTVMVPSTTNFFSQNSIADAYVSDNAIVSFTVKQSIPGNLRKNGTEGMLPLHVTVNLLKRDLQTSGHWDELATEWHNRGDIRKLFSDYFRVYLISHQDDGNDIHWDMSETLQDKGDYYDQVKVFLDGDRECITVSFMMMLMDGTRDGTRPTFDLAQDITNTTENKFIIVRDGKKDNKWNLTCYVAPAGFKENNNSNVSEDKPGDVSSNKGSGGGGGCSALGSGVLLLALTALALKLAGGEK